MATSGPEVQRSHLFHRTLKSLLPQPLLSLNLGVLGFLLLSLFSPVAAQATDWTGVTQRVLRSVVSIDANGGTVCSGFVIDAQRDYIMTAHHCVERHAVAADGRPAAVVYYNVADDVAVLQAPTDRPALERTRRSLAAGQAALAAGFAYGFPRPQVRHTMITNPVYLVPGFGTFIAFDAGVLVPGMSGGPIVDRDGRVVSLNQNVLSTDHGIGETGLGRSIYLIYALTKAFWA